MTQDRPNIPRLGIYFDAFKVSPYPWGVRLELSQNSIASDSQQRPIPPTEPDVFYTSLEHFKVMAFIFCRQLMLIEQSLDIVIPCPEKVLTDVLKTDREKWERFWYGWKSGGAFGPSSQDGNVKPTPALSQTLPL